MGECRSAEISPTSTLLSSSKGLGLVSCSKIVESPDSAAAEASASSGVGATADAGVDAPPPGGVKSRFDLRLHSAIEDHAAAALV